MNHLRDTLTNCENRAAFDAALAIFVERAQAEYFRFTLVILDIDHFKSVNDAFGHLRGDRALVEVAKRLNGAVRLDDRVFRIGGDEFALLLPCTGRDEIRMLVDRLLAILPATPLLGDPPLSLSISLGTALFPDEATTPEQLVAVADRRHYAAKRTGRARAVIEDDPLDDLRPQPPARLIERDALLQDTRALFADMEHARRGLLRLVGVPGAGATRALAEVHTLAELLGYATLPMRGTPAVRRRLNGALSRALRAIPSMGERIEQLSLADALSGWVIQEGKRGLLISIDDLHDIDSGSIDWVGKLIDHPGLPRLVVAAACEPGFSAIDQLERPEGIRRVSELRRLTEEGLRVWVRQSLRWEPPDELISYLVERSHRLPGPFWRIVQILIDTGALARDGETWRLDQSFRSVPIEAALDRRQRWPVLQLPAGLPEFIGRADEVTRLIEMVSQHRLTTLIGPGGIGKTRLALQVAAEAGERFAHGAVCISLAGITSTDRVIPYIADVLGIGGSADLATAICALLDQQQRVLVLDNLEHLSGVEHIVRMLIDTTEKPHLLLTSRERPALGDSLIVELGGLDILPVVDASAIERSDAILFFIQRARQVRPGFTLELEDIPAVERICRLLDGMPLGIELAAGWITTNTCEEIAERIAAHLDAIQVGRHGRSKNQGHVLAALETFWERLSPGEATMLSRLGLFRGVFHPAAATSIATASPFFLSGLVVSGYLRRAPDGYFEIHELLRQYAQAQLQRLPHDYLTTSERFAAYYAQLLDTSRPALLAGGALLQPLRREMPNIMASWDWIVTRGRMPLLAGLAPGMARYWETIGQLHVVRPLLDTTVQQLRTRLCSDQGNPAMQRPLQSVLAHLLCRIAWSILLDAESTYQSATELLAEAEQAARSACEPARLKECFLMQAIDALHDDLSYVTMLLEQAIALPSDASLHAECIRFQGIVSAIQSDTAGADVSYQAAFRLFEQEGDRLGMARTLVNLADSARERELLTLSSERLDQLIAVARSIGSPELEIVGLLMSAQLSIELCVLDQARQRCDSAQRLIRNSSNFALESWLYQIQGSLFYLTGHPQVEEQCQRLREACLKLSGRNEAAWLQVMIGHVFCDRGDFAAARHHYQHALEELSQQADPINQYEVQARLALASLESGDREAAARLCAGILERLPRDLSRLSSPFLALQALYHALSALDDPQATAVIQMAQSTLAHRCEGILDPSARAHYHDQHVISWPILSTAVDVVP